MKLCAFIGGLGVGLMAGVVTDRMAADRKTRRAVGRTMERVGKAMDSALDDVKSCLH